MWVVSERIHVTKQGERPILHRIADGRTGGLVRGLIALFSDVRRGIGLSIVAEAVRRGDIGKAVETVSFDRVQQGLLVVLTPVITDVVITSGKEMHSRLPPRVKQDTAFNAREARLQDWLDTHIASLIVQVTEETREAVRGVVERAIRQGLHPDRAAGHIRELVGLTRRQGLAVDNYRARLVTAGRSQAQIERFTSRYAEQLHTYRANNIARTELMTAANRGHYESIRQMVELGRMTGATKRWITVPDDRRCEWCAPMHNQMVPFDAMFTSGLGNVEHPPLHPQCRCLVSFAGGELPPK